MKKADDEQTEKDLQCEAKLCGGENWLKALGSVAIYLADWSTILTNDPLRHGQRAVADADRQQQLGDGVDSRPDPVRRA